MRFAGDPFPAFTVATDFRQRDVDDDDATYKRDTSEDAGGLSRKQGEDVRNRSEPLCASCLRWRPVFVDGLPLRGFFLCFFFFFGVHGDEVEGEGGGGESW